MRRNITIIFAVMILCLAAAGCSGKSAGKEKTVDESTAAFSGDQGKTDASSAVFPYRFADREEGMELLMANEEYYDGFSENELEYKMQKKNADMEEYKAFAREQVCDFTDKEKKLIEDQMSKIGQIITDNGYHLPPLKEIVFICTTMAEEGDAGAYTHGTQIYIGKEVLEFFADEGENNPGLEYLLTHELFHCLTRSNPAFRADMYSIIHFTVQEKEYAIPPSVMEYYISNPDVEHHNAYAEFVIGGEPVDCFMAVVTRKHFEKEGEQFFDTATAALVPVDGTDVYYYPEDAANYDEILGKNTDYTIDPEECMADNFAYTIVFGKDGPDGHGYETPEIIDAIRSYLKK